jgi:hypothetical protein
MGNSQASKKIGSRDERNVKADLRTVVAQERVAQLSQIKGRFGYVPTEPERAGSPSGNSLSTGWEVVEKKSASSVGANGAIVHVIEKASVLIERKGEQFIKDDLFGLILLVNPIKWQEMTTSGKNYTCEELRFILREMMTNPELIKKSIEQANGTEKVKAINSSVSDIKEITF